MIGDQNKGAIAAQMLFSDNFETAISPKQRPDDQRYERTHSIDEHVWLPTSVKFKADGRALFAIRKLNIDFAVEWFDYRRVSPATVSP